MQNLHFKKVQMKTRSHTLVYGEKIPFGFLKAQILVTGLISGPRELLINLSFWLSI